MRGRGVTREMKMSKRSAVSGGLLWLLAVSAVHAQGGGSCEQPVPANQAPLAGVAVGSGTAEEDVAAADDVMPGDATASEPVAEIATPVEPAVAVEAAPDPAPEPAPAPPKPVKKAVAPGGEAWWPGRAAGKLNIERVQGGAYSASIVIRTDGRFENAESANTDVRVTRDGGSVVPAAWSVAADKKTLLLAVPAGRYKVEIGAGLKDSGGATVARASSGRVVVR
jgi:hypothetical protein